MRDMAPRRYEGAYKQLQLILSMPGVTDDQKRSAIQRFQGTINKGGRWDPASGFQWPTTPPTPGI